MYNWQVKEPSEGRWLETSYFLHGRICYVYMYTYIYMCVLYIYMCVPYANNQESAQKILRTRLKKENGHLRKLVDTLDLSMMKKMAAE